MSPTATVTALLRYPLKSGHAEVLDEAAVEPWGLAEDRRWMVVDGQDQMVTGRQVPDLVRVRARSDARGLVLEAPGRDVVHLDRPGPGERVQADVFGSRFLAAPVPGSEAWVAAVTGRPGRLLHLDDPRARAADPRHARPGDLVSLADGFPLLLTAEASLQALNGWVAEGPHAAEGPLPMGRFRPNVVVAGTPAWAEDRWRRVRIGAVVFRAVKACERCAFTRVDPETAERTREPLVTLAQRRRWDGKIWFGVNLVPDDPGALEAQGALVRVGDAVEVLDAVDDPDPQR